VTEDEQEGELEIARPEAMKVVNENSGRIWTSDKHVRNGLQAAACACAKDAVVDQCTTS